jgi:hypothetical protein
MPDAPNSACCGDIRLVGQQTKILAVLMLSKKVFLALAPTCSVPRRRE